MKKATALVSALLLAVSLTACGGGQASGGQGAGADSVLAGEVGGEITVSCYDSMEYKAFLEGAARLFEEQYPGTKVHVETFSAMPEIKTSEQDGNVMTAITVQDDPQGRADYISKVSTALMSGGGADVLAMDVLPVYKFAGSGLLENLDAYMAGDPAFNRADYRENILDAVKYQGGTWFLPMDYQFGYYAYDSTLLSADIADFGTGSAFSAEQLIDVAKPVFDGSGKLFNSADYLKSLNAGMFSRLLDESYTDYVDVENKTASFDDGSFAALLTAVKEYGELGYIPQGATGQTDAGMMMRRSGESPTDRYFFKPKVSYSLIQQFNRDSGRKINIMMAGEGGGIEDDDEIAGIQANKDGSVPFTYAQAYGINANSQNKRTAWEFIRFLLGDDMQVSTNLSLLALPLRNSARAQKAEMVLSGAFMGRGEELDDAQRAVLQNYIDAVEALSGQINSYTFRDSTIDDIIAAEVGYFFDGSKTAGEVADVLQSRIELYLNE